MSSVIECLFCLGFTRWAFRRCTHSGAHDSASWPAAAPPAFSPIPRAVRAVLAVYEPDLSSPRWAPSPNGYLMDPAAVLKRAAYPDLGGRCPPYILYLDRGSKELIVAVRGLNLVRDGDYRVLLDNTHQAFDDGFVHRGLLKAAVWVLNREAETIARALGECGDEYKLVFAGHSLGAGVAALMAVVAVNYLDRFGGIERSRVRGYAIAPPRCLSLGLAVKYADVVHSVVLQDDFLPRTPTPLEHIFGSIFCLPCLLVIACMRDTFTSEEKKLKDPKRFYAPGRMFHIVERKSCSSGRLPPEVRTAIPVEGRFEHIVLSCNAICDHRIVWIEREAQKALEIMEEGDKMKTPPTQQMMERDPSLETEHKDAMERALLLDVPYVASLGEFCEENNSLSPLDKESLSSVSKSSSRSDWDGLVEELLNEGEKEEQEELTIGDSAIAIVEG